jgi:hypothetical protein
MSEGPKGVLPVVIGLTGKARSGKDTAAGYLVREHGFTRIGYADAVKEMALAIDPLLIGPVYTESATIPSSLRYEQQPRLSGAVREYGWETAKNEYPELRRFLQRLGTEAVRGILGQDTWIEKVWRKIHDGPAGGRYVISDVRFPNEAERVDREGGSVVRIIRSDQKDTGTHASETEMDRIVEEYTIYNIAGDLSAMFARLDGIVSRLA